MIVYIKLKDGKVIKKYGVNQKVEISGGYFGCINVVYGTLPCECNVLSVLNKNVKYISCSAKQVHLEDIHKGECLTIEAQELKDYKDKIKECRERKRLVEEKENWK